MDDASFLESALAQYEQALNRLQSKKGVRPEQVLEVLLARDRVQTAIEQESSFSTAHLIQLKALDQALKDQRTIITKTIRLKDWQHLTQHSETDWWWSLESPALFSWLEQSHPWLESLDWLWKLLTIVTLTISATFILNTLRRVLAGGLDAAGTFAMV